MVVDCHPARGKLHSSGPVASAVRRHRFLFLFLRWSRRFLLLFITALLSRPLARSPSRLAILLGQAKVSFGQGSDGVLVTGAKHRFVKVLERSGMTFRHPDTITEVASLVRCGRLRRRQDLRTIIGDLSISLCPPRAHALSGQLEFSTLYVGTSRALR